MGGAQRRTKPTDEQVALFLSALTFAPPSKLGTIGPKDPEEDYKCSFHGRKIDTNFHS
jgi:hypothetical protein